MTSLNPDLIYFSVYLIMDFNKFPVRILAGSSEWAATHVEPLQTVVPLSLCTVGGSLGMLYHKAGTWKSNLPQCRQLISLLIL